MANPMNYRSTNAEGRFVHFGGALVVGHEYYNGVEFNPASTNVAPTIRPAGDDTNIPLAILGKGTNGVQVGSTAAGSMEVKGAFSTTFAWTHAAISSGQFGEIKLASTTADVQPGDLISVQPASTYGGPYGFAGFRQSTADASRVTVLLDVPGSTATSTLSGTLRITWLDLT